MNAIPKGPKSKLLKLQQVRLLQHWAPVGKYMSESDPLKNKLKKPTRELLVLSLIKHKRILWFRTCHVL